MMPEPFTCPGCHDGDFPDFDHFCDALNVIDAEAPHAFAAWLGNQTEWTQVTTNAMTLQDLIAAKEQMEDEYLKPCQLCGGTGIDPVKGSIKADAKAAAAKAMKKIRKDLEAGQ